jgi:hypothetical protein
MPSVTSATLTGAKLAGVTVGMDVSVGGGVSVGIGDEGRTVGRCGVAMTEVFDVGRGLIPDVGVSCREVLNEQPVSIKQRIRT